VVYERQFMTGIKLPRGSALGCQHQGFF